MSALARNILLCRSRVAEKISRRYREHLGLRDEQGMMMMTVTLVLITILSIIAFTITAQAIGQFGLTSNVSNRNGALEGALSGVQAVVANIRAAAQDGYVVTSELPCSDESGQTNISGSSSFMVSVQYQDQTPQGTYTSVTCTQGLGPAAGASGDFLARAVITSCSPETACPTDPNAAPSGSTVWRRLVSTYDFNTYYANIPGGLIWSYSGEQCFEASYNNGSSPSGGVTLEVTNSCSSTNSFERFAYTTNWNLAIQLAGGEYCVEDPEDVSPAASSPVALTTSSCATNAVDQWGVNDDGGIEGVETASVPAGQPNGWCLANPLSANPTTTETEDATVENTDCDSQFDNTATWLLSPQVGAGASQPASGQVFGITNQLVNFQEFGDCLDATNASVQGTYTNYTNVPGVLIDYMCKQFPDTTDYPLWNQRWCFNQLSTTTSGNLTLPVGVIYTPYTTDGDTVTCSNPPPTSVYCLISPLQAASSSGGSTAWVRVYTSSQTSCDPASSYSSQPDDLLWTEWGDSGGTTHEYTWTDDDGYCLEANTANKQYPSGNGDEFSTIQVDTCNGSYEQKWNAPPLLGTSQITNTHEGTGNGPYSGS